MKMIKHFKFLNTIGILVVTGLIVSACSSSKKEADSNKDLNRNYSDKATITKGPTESDTSSKNTKKNSSGFKNSSSEHSSEALKFSSSNSNYLQMAQNNQLEQIKETATKALSVKADDVDALNALAFVYYQQLKYGAARMILSRALEKNPNSSQTYTNLGVLDIAENENVRATLNLKKALKFDDHNIDAAQLLGGIYLHGGDSLRALSLLEMAYKARPQNLSLANNYALALVYTKSYDQAAKIYDEIVEKNSREVPILINYASLLIDNLNKPKEGLNLIYKVKYLETEKKDIIELANNLEKKARANLK